MQKNYSILKISPNQNVTKMDPYRFIVWTFLDVKDLIQFSSTCTTLREIVDDPETWRYLSERDYGEEFSKKDYIHFTQMRENWKENRDVREFFKITSWKLKDIFFDPIATETFNQRCHNLFHEVNLTQQILFKRDYKKLTAFISKSVMNRTRYVIEPDRDTLVIIYLLINPKLLSHVKNGIVKHFEEICEKFWKMDCEIFDVMNA